jgi:hypothetical protein|tara:strand:+ start:200 stop:766 length:567 start_codon:yes stop_codon:yes gene_type:complete
MTAIGMHPADANAQGSSMGNPIYLGGCYWDSSSEIAEYIDPVKYGQVQSGNTSGDGIGDTVGELTYPTNSTNQSGGLEGDGNILNSITQFTEQTGKTLEMARNFMGGTYVIDVISNVTIGCEVVYETIGGNDDTDCPVDTDIGEWCSVKKSNIVWDYFIQGFSTLIAFAVVIAILQIVRPFNTGSASM